ncbi:MAG: AAA family ATPase [Dehalococcoidia bacterium]|nr:AAA family ATPase [Dehalococcoidia bacterium]
MFPDYITSLLAKDMYSHDVDQVILEQTHLSYVLLAGNFVYKIKKSVDFPFVHQSELSQRYNFCVQEVEQNKRLAKEVYIKVVKIIRNESGKYEIVEGEVDPCSEIIEYAVKMRRLKVDDNLENIIMDNALPVDIAERIVNCLIPFHQNAEIFSEGLDAGGFQAERKWCNEELSQQAQHINKTLKPKSAQIINQYMQESLLKFEKIFDLRYLQNKIIFGHGDLQIKHFYLDAFYEETLLIIDCIEFSTDFHFKYVDQGYDLAFLTMGLDFHNQSILADVISGLYIASAGDKYLSLLHNYHKFLRALIRGKVEGLAVGSESINEHTKKKNKLNSEIFFNLAEKYALKSTTPFICSIGGLSGSGKSVIGGAIASRIGAVYLSSDVIRKELFKIPLHEHLKDNSDITIYDYEANISVYTELRKQATEYVKQGFSVVIDAAHLLRDEREETMIMMESLSINCCFLWIESTAELIKQRINKRMNSAYYISDADFNIYKNQLDYVEDIQDNENIISISNTGSIQKVIANLPKIAKVLRDRFEY